MQIVKPRVEVWPFDGKAMLRDIESVARVCYKSEELAGEGTAEKLVAHLLSSDPPHMAMLDHAFLRAKFVVDRGITHEIVRHRIGVAYAQESTRYCNYSKGKFGGEITVIEPPGLDAEKRGYWYDACAKAEYEYLALVNQGTSPQIARSVLPTCLKTEIVVTATLTAWRHFFRLRTGKRPHPQMFQVMVPLCHHLQNKIPLVFDSFGPMKEQLERMKFEGIEPAEVVQL